MPFQARFAYVAAVVAGTVEGGWRLHLVELSAAGAPYDLLCGGRT